MSTPQTHATPIVRPATVEDVAMVQGSSLSWLQPDGWRPDGHSLVLVDDGSVVGAALRVPNDLHPERDGGRLQLTDAVDHAGATALVDALRRARPHPLALKAVPGTAEQAAAAACGATPYQRCPPGTVHTESDELRAWCHDQIAATNQPALEIRSGRHWEQHELVELWAEFYEVIHAEWSPISDRATLLRVFTPMIHEQLNADRTRFATAGDEVVAACFVFGADGGALEANAEALISTHPLAGEAVAGCMAHVMLAADGASVTFDGHLGDPYVAGLLQSLPVPATGGWLDLLELSASPAGTPTSH